MNKLLNSMPLALVSLLLIIIVIIITFSLRTVWWAFFDVFFAFMAAFCQIMGLYVKRFSRSSGKLLQTIAAVCLSLAILSFIGEFIAYQILIP